jgi:hypothetical protein
MFDTSAGMAGTSVAASAECDDDGRQFLICDANWRCHDLAGLFAASHIIPQRTECPRGDDRQQMNGVGSARHRWVHEAGRGKADQRRVASQPNRLSWDETTAPSMGLSHLAPSDDGET